MTREQEIERLQIKLRMVSVYLVGFEDALQSLAPELEKLSPDTQEQDRALLLAHFWAGIGIAKTDPAITEERFLELAKAAWEMRQAVDSAGPEGREP